MEINKNSAQWLIDMIVENSRADMMITGSLVGSVVGMIASCAMLIFGFFDYQSNEAFAYLSVLACMAGAAVLGSVLGLRHAKILEEQDRKQGNASPATKVFVV